MNFCSNIAFIAAPQSLDVLELARFRNSVQALCKKGCYRLIINMKETTYIDSSGVGFLLKLSHHIQEKGGLLSLACVQPLVLHVLKVTRSVDYIPVLPNPSETIAPLDPALHPIWKKTFAVTPESFCLARRRLGELLRTLPLSETEVFDTTLAVGEALGNALDHTDAFGVRLVTSCYRDRVLFDVTDCGSGFDEKHLFAASRASFGVFGEGQTKARKEASAKGSTSAEEAAAEIDTQPQVSKVAEPTAQEPTEQPVQSQAPEAAQPQESQPQSASQEQEQCCVQERGRGIKLMKLLLDAVWIEQREGLSGTVVHLVKLLR